jgi:hypothetical protein
MISKARVCELVSYDPATGVFTRLKSRANWIGKPAGKLVTNGARQILLDGQTYLAHRLAWLVMTGEWPQGEIDHKDCNPANNAWDNLRLATRAQNMQNIRVFRGVTGVKGLSHVNWKGRHRWRVTVSAQGERVFSHFVCFGQAMKHAAKLRAELHGEFANNGLAA